MVRCKKKKMLVCASAFVREFVHFTCCISFIVTFMSSVISLWTYDCHTVLAIKSVMDIFKTGEYYLLLSCLELSPTLIHHCSLLLTAHEARLHPTLNMLRQLLHKKHLILITVNLVIFCLFQLQKTNKL